MRMLCHRSLVGLVASVAFLSALFAVADSCTKVAGETASCAAGAPVRKLVALDDADGVSLLQTSQWSQAGLDRGRSSLDEATETLMKDSKALQDMMEGWSSQDGKTSIADSEGFRTVAEQAAPVQSQASWNVLPGQAPQFQFADSLAAPQAPAPSASQAEVTKLLQEISIAKHQRDAAVNEAGRLSQSLAFTKSEVELAMLQAAPAPATKAATTEAPATKATTTDASKATTAATTDASKATTAASTTAAPAAAASGSTSTTAASGLLGKTTTVKSAAPTKKDKECEPGIKNYVTFHCRVALWVGILIWIFLAFSIFVCCGFTIFFAMDMFRVGGQARDAAAAGQPLVEGQAVPEAAPAQ